MSKKSPAGKGARDRGRPVGHVEPGYAVSLARAFICGSVCVVSTMLCRVGLSLQSLQLEFDANVTTAACVIDQHAGHTHAQVRGEQVVGTQQSCGLPPRGMVGGWLLNTRQGSWLVLVS